MNSFPTPFLSKPPAYTPEDFLAAVLVRYPPPIAELALRARALVRSQLATVTEEIRLNDAHLVLGYCVTDYATDGIVALLVSDGSVVFSFRQLRPLPVLEGVLTLAGDGTTQVMEVTAALLAAPLTLKAVLRAAALHAIPRPKARGAGITVVRTE